VSGFAWRITIKSELHIQREQSRRARLLAAEANFTTLRDVASHRNPRLFSEFLPKGYRLMTLSSVDEALKDRLLDAKLHLGMLITLYDDLADNPRWANSKLLHELYKLPFHSQSIRPLRLNSAERKVVELAKHLADGTFPILTSLPHFGSFAPLLHFDLQQFYNANRYCEMLSRIPSLANTTEGSTYVSHNMGMVIVGMMDLMGTSNLYFSELGEIRSLFVRGQRVGRICNVLTTLGRELSEGDVTNELILGAIQSGYVKPSALGELTKRKLAPFRQELEKERRRLYREISAQRDRIRTFDVRAYVRGLRGLQRLHENMEGVL